MVSWDDLFKSPAKRKAEQDRKRREAIVHAKTALRRERRSIAKRQGQADATRLNAVQYEKQGKPALAKQLVRQFILMDKECIARTLALHNMEYALEQAQAKENWEEFVKAMRIVADIEELAQSSVDPDQVRERLMDMAQRNQDMIEPWLETAGVEVAGLGSEVRLTDEEREAYTQVIADAAGQIASASPERPVSESAKMSRELERKMDEALGKE